jgi:hypothetical protein
MRESTQALSVSAVLENIVQTARRAQQKAAMENSIATYYSSLSNEEQEEHAMWGEFALGELINEGR